jgi:hypothetical protein
MNSRMLELRLRTGAVVAFDGRILEVFDGGSGRRFHLTQLGTPEVVRHAEGSQTLTVPGTDLSIRFARAEEPACTRLLIALADAQAADERLRG